MRQHRICRSCGYRQICGQRGYPFADNQICRRVNEIVNQDCSGLREMLTPDGDIDIIPRRLQTPNPAFHRKRETILLMRLIDHMTVAEIAERLYVSRQYIYRVLSEARRILNSK